jgi:hypothetical protein
MVCGLKKVEKECAHNIELQWLLCAIIPTTIAYPTLENPSGLKICSNSLFLLKDADLIGCEIIAIDGTKSRAHNSKANFNQRKLRDLVYIEERTQEYLAELAKMMG